MASKAQFPEFTIFPVDGMSRWGQFEPFCPVSRETFRKLSLEGRAPQPIRLGLRCTMYSNKELHRWLDNPVAYQAELTSVGCVSKSSNGRGAK